MNPSQFIIHKNLLRFYDSYVKELNELKIRGRTAKHKVWLNAFIYFV